MTVIYGLVISETQGCQIGRGICPHKDKQNSGNFFFNMSKNYTSGLFFLALGWLDS